MVQIAQLGAVFLEMNKVEAGLDVAKRDTGRGQDAPVVLGVLADDVFSDA